MTATEYKQILILVKTVLVSPPDSILVVFVGWCAPQSTRSRLGAAKKKAGAGPRLNNHQKEDLEEKA
jgi:hypothetical protein